MIRLVVRGIIEGSKKPIFPTSLTSCNKAIIYNYFFLLLIPLRLMPCATTGHGPPDTWYYHDNRYL